MKSLITFLFIIVASTTYRCGKEEETIDCVAVTAQMIGTWDVTLSYTNPGTAYSQGGLNNYEGPKGTQMNMVLDITETSECGFSGTMTYGAISNNHSFNVNGSIDKYGWVFFTESTYDNDGGLFTDCLNKDESWRCYRWPTNRWQTGGQYSEGRFDSDDFEWEGEFIHPATSWSGNICLQQPCSDFSWKSVGDITGLYKIQKK